MNQWIEKYTLGAAQCYCTLSFVAAFYSIVLLLQVVMCMHNQKCFLLVNFSQ